MNDAWGVLGHIFRESFVFPFNNNLYFSGSETWLNYRGGELLYIENLFSEESLFPFSGLRVCPGFSSPRSPALLLSSCRLPPASPAPPEAYPNTPAFLTKCIDTSPSPLSGYCPVPATQHLTMTLDTPLIQFLHPPAFPVSPFRSSHSGDAHQR